MAMFSATLRIYPVTMRLAHPKTDMECGGKVVLPVSALHVLTSRVSFLQKSPMLFMISFGTKNTHCGVLEFTAEEGNVNVPSWILDTLQAKVGDTVQELGWELLLGDGKKVAFAFGVYNANLGSKPVYVCRFPGTSPVPGMLYQTKPRRDFVVLLNLFRYQPRKLIYMLFAVAFISAIAISSVRSLRYPKDQCDDSYHYYGGLYGARYPVPNIVHFYRGGREARNLTVSDAACIEAALRLQGPVYIHTDDLTAATEAALRAGLHSRVTLLPAPVSTSLSIPDSILWVYGGVFMKNDVYLLRNINIMRADECSRTPGGDIIASTKEAVRASKVAARPLSGVILDKDWGALYIMDVLKNCTVRAVRLGTRNEVTYRRNLNGNPR